MSTIAGAMEGSALGIPSIALSQSYGWAEGAEIQWACGEVQGPPLIRKLVGVSSRGTLTFIIVLLGVISSV